MRHPHSRYPRQHFNEQLHRRRVRHEAASPRRFSNQEQFCPDCDEDCLGLGANMGSRTIRFPALHDVLRQPRSLLCRSGGGENAAFGGQGQAGWRGIRLHPYDDVVRQPRALLCRRGGGENAAPGGRLVVDEALCLLGSRRQRRGRAGIPTPGRVRRRHRRHAPPPIPFRRAC